MRIIVRFFITLVLLLSTTHAIEYKDMEKISLKKDEQTKILVKYKTYTKLLTFRWTLYVNEGLVVFHSYDKNVAQTILYLNTKNQSFKVLLKPKGTNQYEVPYILVKFKEFDFKKHKANFEVFISDKRREILVNYLKNK